MSYNDDNEWQTAGGNRHRNRQESDSDGPWRRNDNQSENDGPWRRNDNQPSDYDERRQQGDYSRAGYQPNEEQFPTLGGQQNPHPTQSQEQSSWRPQNQTHTNAHKEDSKSNFSMRGMFSALKKTVKEALKAKFHELTDEVRHSYKLRAHEQQYSEPVHLSESQVNPTQEELGDISRAANKLWDLDLNRLTPGKDYEIDVGEGKKVYDKRDEAQNTLFRHLDPSVFRRPTYARFVALLDNYNADEHVKENVTAQDLQEETAFIEEISRTAPIQYLQKYLAAQNVIQGSDQQFKQTLHNLWFKLYNRGGTQNSSSAFEHVFVGEIKHLDNNTEEVSGLHNWIQFYVEEAKGAVDYQGFIFPRRRADPQPDAMTHLLTLQFKWNGLLKNVSSSLIGVSPEFELALYTLCYYGRSQDNHVTLGPYNVNVKVYPLGQYSIGSAYPIAED